MLNLSCGETQIGHSHVCLNSLGAFRFLPASFPALFLDIARYAFGKGQKNLLDINQKSSQRLMTDWG